MKYDKKLLFDYITGNEIAEYNIDDLENDCEFMISIINLTNDKRMYNLCSNNVKKNYDFVKYIINKFSNDIDFICNVADIYLENTNDELSRMELVFIMCDLTKEGDYDYHKKYEIIAQAIKVSKKVIIEMYKNATMKDSKFLDVIGMGFWFIFDEYNESDVILNYFAKEYLVDIFYKDASNLEKMIHTDFKIAKELDEYGVKNYLLNCIMINDYNLYIYIVSHLELLDIYIKKVDGIISRWEIYLSLEEYDRYNKMFNNLHNYIVENEGKLGFNETQILYFIGREIGILDKLKKYDYLDVSYIDDMLEDIGIDKENMSFVDLRHYCNIKKIIVESLNDVKEEKQVDKDFKSIVLSFDKGIYEEKH